MTLYRVDDAQVRDAATGELLTGLVGRPVQIVNRDTSTPAAILDETGGAVPESTLTVTPVYTVPRFWIESDDPIDLYLDWLDPETETRGAVEFEAVLRDAARSARDAATASAVTALNADAAAQGAAVAAQTAAAEAAASADLVGAPADDAVGVMLSSAASVTSATLRSKWLDGVRPELYGAVGDGVANDTAAITAAIASGAKTFQLTHGKTYLIDPDALVFPAGSQILGGFNNGYTSGTQAARLVVRNTGGTFGIQVGNNSHIEGVYVTAETLPDYYRGDWVTGTGRASIGIDAGADSAVIGCGAFGVETGILAGKSTLIDRANVGSCKYGIRTDGPDGWIANCTINFCTDAGVKIAGNFWRVSNNRLEWNARYGLDGSGELTVVGNLFDRNGWAGLNLPSGAWGAVVTGNYFCRNGVGGDGTSGRWGWAVPGNPAYVTTTSAQSCHIELAYQRGVTITGNRFRSGQDDSNAGSHGPSHIYSVNGGSGATPPSALMRFGNPGEYVSGGVSGYNSPGPYGDGSIAIGTDTALVTWINTGGQRFPSIVSSTGYSTARDQAASASTLTIVPEKSHGVVFLRGSRSGSGVQSVIYFGQDASPGNAKYATFENKQGAMISTVSRAADGGIVLTFGTTYFTNYTIIYSG